MMKWIRWWGFIPFLAVVAIFAILWFFLIDGWIERAIEKGGSRLVGAKIELDSADLSLSPAGLTLNGLRITDPDRPMTNAVEVGRIALTIDTLNLLRRKLIVEEMTADNIRFNTPRTSSGALPRVAPKKKKPKTGEPERTISFTLPDVKEVLKKERLKSLEEIDTLNKDISARKAKWEKRLSKLPDKATFKQYEKRIEKIKKGSKGIAVITEIMDLQKEMEAHIRELETADRDYTVEIKSLKYQVKDIKKVQEKDIKRIVNKYGFGGRGMANLGKLLFGPRIAGYVSTALTWYERIGPVIERRKAPSDGAGAVRPLRGKGVNVRFKEREPLPDLLVRSAQASMHFKDSSIGGTINNITPEQDILGKPTVFSFSGKDVGDAGSVEIAGTLDHINPGASTDTVKVIIKKLIINNVTLSEEETFPVSLADGISDIELTASVAGDTINSTIKADLKRVHIQTKERPSNSVEKAVVSVLKDVSSISLTALISGTRDAYDVEVSSSIDRILEQAVNKQLRRERDRFRNGVRSEIESRVKKPLNKAVESFGELLVIDKEIGSRLNYATGVLKDSGKKPTGVLEKYLQ